MNILKVFYQYFENILITLYAKKIRRNLPFFTEKHKRPWGLYFGHISLQLLGNSSVIWFSTEAHCHTVILLLVVIQSLIIHFFSLTSLISCGINSPIHCLEDSILGVVILCEILWNTWSQNTAGQIHPWSSFTSISAVRPKINLTL